jgi:hypothetical protein
MAATVAAEMMGPMPGTVVQGLAGGILFGQCLGLARYRLDTLVEPAPVEMSAETGSWSERDPA